MTKYTISFSPSRAEQERCSSATNLALVMAFISTITDSQEANSPEEALQKSIFAEAGFSKELLARCVLEEAR